MKILPAVLLLATSVASASGLDSLESKPAPFDGLPNLDRPVYLAADSLVCVGGSDVVGTSKAFMVPPADPQIIAALRSNGCAFSDRETRVVVTPPDAGSPEYQNEKYWQYVGIMWRNPSGIIWHGYAMVERLHN